jgi:hypothetical protein
LTIFSRFKNQDNGISGFYGVAWFFACGRSLLLICFLSLMMTSKMGLGSDDLPSALSSKQIIGWLELIHLYPGRLSIRAKMDTGAKTASLNAARLTEFDKNGANWVRFTVTNKKGAAVKFEEKILRYAKIKAANGTLEKRPVIQLWLCLGDRMHAVEVNLTDRSFFNYQMIIGRNVLKGKYVIDAERTFTIKPGCKPGGDALK